MVCRRVSSRWGRLCDFLVRRATRASDTPRDASVRRAVLNLSFVFCLVGTSFVLVSRGTGRTGSSVAVGGSFVSFIAMLCGAPVNAASAFLLLCSSCASLLNDWAAAAGLKLRNWSMVVIFTDVSLTLRLPEYLNAAIITLTMLHVMVERAEAVFRFGVYELTDSSVPQVCDCVDPPCARDLSGGVGGVLIVGFVFLVDFGITRSFSLQAQRQLSLVQASVEAAAEVTTFLSKYQVDKAAAALQESSNRLPSQLLQAFLTLTENLNTYRPYLPQSCLEADDALTAAEVESVVSRLSPEKVSATSDSIVSAAPTDSTDDYSRQGSGVGPSTKKAGALSSVPQVRHVTLLCTNKRGFVETVRTSATEDVKGILAGLVQDFCSEVAGTLGVVDLVNGDHSFASWNASRPCINARARGVRCAGALRNDTTRTSVSSRLAGKVCVAMCAGHTLCGDFGCSTLRRFMVLGPLSALQMAVDRIAAHLSIEWLAADPLGVEVSLGYEARIAEAVRWSKAPFSPVCLWEVLQALDRGASGPSEWMYELAAGSPWDVANEARLEWVSGGIDAALKVLEPKGVRSPSSPKPGPQHGLDELRSLIQSGRSAVLSVRELELVDDGDGRPQERAESGAVEGMSLTEFGS